MQARPSWFLLLSIALTVTGFHVTHVTDLSAQEIPDWEEIPDTRTWHWRLETDLDTVKRPRSQLDSILDMHRIWRETNGDDGERAHLGGASLYRADLRKANLYRAFLGEAHLGEADLTYADLTGAFLVGANLTGAILHHANLRSAVLDGATINGVWFEPDSLPEVTSLITAKGLRTIRWLYSPEKIVELRERFSELGFRQQEREVICALRRHDAGLLEYVFFDLTSEYGSNLPRIWKIIIGIWLAASVLYYVFMLSEKKSCIILTEIGRSVLLLKRDRPVTSGQLDLARDIHYTIHIRNKQLRDTRPSWFMRKMFIVRLIGWALFFSAISAFNIGFRDINFGRWLRLLTRKEFDLRPVGWVRVISGFQALMSVYLIALWILSFSGTPFK